MFRTARVPAEFLETPNTVHGIREAQSAPKRAEQPIRPISPWEVWRKAKVAWTEEGIPDAPQLTTKGLCHGYGINAVGKEEKDITAKMRGKVRWT